MGNTVLMGIGPGPYKKRIKSWENEKCGNTKLGVYCINLASHLSERKFRYLTWYKLHSPLHSNIKIKKLYIHFSLSCPVSNMAKHYNCHTEGSWTRTL